VESSQPAVPYKRIYQMRMIDFFGLRTHIIYQDDNGPCTLVAICKRTPLFVFYFSYHDIDLTLFSCEAGNVLLLKGVIKFEVDVREVPEDKLLSLLQGVLEESEKMKVGNACLQFLCHECEHDLLCLGLSLTPFLQCEGLDCSVLQRQVRDVISILPLPVEMNMCFNR